MLHDLMHVTCVNREQSTACTSASVVFLGLKFFPRSTSARRTRPPPPPPTPLSLPISATWRSTSFGCGGRGSGGASSGASFGVRGVGDSRCACDSEATPSFELQPRVLGLPSGGGGVSELRFTFELALALPKAHRAGGAFGRKQ
jgi:hypothetical protein